MSFGDQMTRVSSITREADYDAALREVATCFDELAALIKAYEDARWPIQT